MPKKVKKTGVVVTIPETWESEQVDKDGNRITYHLGGGKIKIFNLLDREETEVRKKASGMGFEMSSDGTGHQVVTFDTEIFQEEIFLKRTRGLDRNDCYWEGFFDDQDPPREMNCTEENLRDYAHETPIYLFVCHVGKLLDAEAESRATEEEKNSLDSFVQQPENANGSTGTDAKHVRKNGRKE